MSACDESVELVKSTNIRTILRMRTQMPLTNYSCVIAYLMQYFRNIFLLERQPGHFVKRIKRRIPPVAKTSLVTARNQSGPTWRAHRIGHISVGETNSLTSNSIDMRCRDILAPIEPHIPVALVVRHDYDQIRPLDLAIESYHGKAIQEADS